METHDKLMFLSTTLLAMLAGCNKLYDLTSATKADSTISADIKDVEVTGKVKTALLLDETIKGYDITAVTT
ncbi:MAG: hypothetical protein Q8M99_08895 [Methylotenera sp.]|nr:hypothetical protein [Methylotenera sp.]